MFFTDYGQIPKVERCDMDGQNRTKLVDSKIVFPHGITLDLVSRLVYWADAYLDYIEVVDYEGKNRHTIIQGILVSGTHLLFRGAQQGPHLLPVVQSKTPISCLTAHAEAPMSCPMAHAGTPVSCLAAHSSTPRLGSVC